MKITEHLYHIEDLEQKEVTVHSVDGSGITYIATVDNSPTESYPFWIFKTHNAFVVEHQNNVAVSIEIEK